MKRLIFAAMALAIFGLGSVPAHAFHCPADMRKIDAALTAKPDMPKDTMAKVMALRAQGEAEHKSGQHGKSVATLAKAMKLLGMH